MILLGCSISTLHARDVGSGQVWARNRHCHSDIRATHAQGDQVLKLVPGAAPGPAPLLLLHC